MKVISQIKIIATKTDCVTAMNQIEMNENFSFFCSIEWIHVDYCLEQHSQTNMFQHDEKPQQKFIHSRQKKNIWNVKSIR